MAAWQMRPTPRMLLIFRERREARRSRKPRSLRVSLGRPLINSLPLLFLYTRNTRAYSPEYVEGQFLELRLDGVLRSSHGCGQSPTPAGYGLAFALAVR